MKDNLAGRKQHYLPQHLLRGFQASKSGDKIQVVVYKKGTPPYTTATEGVAAQRDFYSQPSDGVIDTLDDVITAFERNTFNPFIDRARAASPNERMDAASAAAAVVHLTIRAAYLRGSFAHVARKMLARFGEILTEPEAVRKFVGIDSTSSDTLVSEEIRKAFGALPTAAITLKERLIFEKMVRFRVREKFDTQMLESVPDLYKQLSRLDDELPRIVERGQIRALQKSLVPVERIEGLKKLEWRVLTVEVPNHFVLPDCAAIASNPSGHLQPLVIRSNDEISWIAMPISASKVLVGYSGQVSPELLNLNEYFAKCSLELFVSSTLQPDLEPLAAQIGEVLEIVTHDLIEESFSIAGHKLEEPVVVDEAPKVGIITVGFESDFCTTTAINQVIQKIFAEQCSAREADRLESIVLTKDVAREVAVLHGRALSPYETAAIVVGTVEILPGAAPPKLRLILLESLAQLLLTSDLRLQRSATSLVKHLFGRVSYFDCWFRNIGPVAEQRTFTARERLCVELVQRFASHHRGSIEAALAVNESDLDDGEPVSAHAVNAALAELKGVRQGFKSYQNADVLITDAAPALDMLLTTLAAYCGLRLNGISRRQLSQFSTTGEHLVRAGLWDWVVLFGQDLLRHYDSTTTETESLEQVLCLAEHVERVLWQFGIFFSDLEDGRIWVDACDDERLKTVHQMLSSD